MKARVAIGPSSFAQKDKSPEQFLIERGVEIVPNPFGRRLSEEEIVEHLKDIDGLIAGLEPLNRKVLSSAAPRLKAVARVGIGVTNVDFDAARELGIKVSNTPEPPARAVAELTITAMLTLCRRLVSTNTAFHGGSWPKSIGMGLEETPVLLIGYGHIGRRVGKLLRAFGARVLVSDPFIEADTLKDGESLVPLEEGLAEAQIVSLHASGDEVVLDTAAFETMRNGVYLLNGARGELVDEAALVAALRSGKVAGAWFDAFWTEPYGGPLLGFEQVLLTPHMGTYTIQCRRQMEMAAVENLMRDLG